LPKDYWVALAVFSLLFFLSDTARSLQVLKRSCHQLDAQEVERLMAIELGGEAEVESLIIILICEGQTLRILAKRSAESEALERSVALVDSHLKERLIALTVSQLVTRAPKTAHSPPLAAPPPEISPSSSTDRRVAALSLCLSGGVKPHAVFTLPTGYVSIRSGIWFTDSVALLWLVSLEGGRFERELGSVKALSGLAGLGAAWRFASYRFFKVELMGAALMGYTRLEGDPDPDSGGGTIGGIAGEFVIGVSPVVITGRFLLALDLKSGYTLENPVGTVDDYSPVTLGGFWLGGGLRLGIQL
jgi:hypothetical protein